MRSDTKEKQNSNTFGAALLHSVNCAKTLTKSNSRDDRVNFTSQVMVIVHPVEKSEQKLRIASQRLGAESGTVKEHCSVACSAPLSSLVFLYNPGLPA